VGFAAIASLASTAACVYHSRDTITRLMSVQILTDEDTLSAFSPPDERSREIDEYLREHPVAVALRADPTFSESRPHLKIPETLRARNLTAGTLAGPNRIAVPPYAFNEAGGKSLVSLLYLGSDVSGHPGIVHGGLLATLLDEGLARCCFPALPNKVGVTANLNIDYRRPAMADSYAVLRADTVKVEGRKAWVEGRIETLPKNGEEPVTLVEAKGLFVEPKQAAVCVSDRC
jgi:acyl-coenzyme A thioesterase PaaI-like protein